MCGASDPWSLIRVQELAILASDPGADVGVELADRGMCAATQFLGGEFGEPAYQEVEPGPGEMQHEVGMVCQPTLYRQRDLWVEALSNTRCMSRSAGTSVSTFLRNAKNSWERCRECSAPMTFRSSDPARRTNSRCRSGLRRASPTARQTRETID